MTKLIASLLFSLILIFQLTCNLPISPDRSIYGTWYLVRSDGSSCYCPHPPLVFVKFDANGILSVYSNDSLLYTGGFKLEYMELHVYPTPYYIYLINPSNLSALFDDETGCIHIAGGYETYNDTLQIISGEMSFNCTSIYTRTKLIQGR